MLQFFFLFAAATVTVVATTIQSYTNTNHTKKSHTFTFFRAYFSLSQGHNQGICFFHIQFQTSTKRDTKIQVKHRHTLSLVEMFWQIISSFHQRGILKQTKTNKQKKAYNNFQQKKTQQIVDLKKRKIVFFFLS